MPRYVLFNRSKEAEPEAIQRLESMPSVTIIDQVGNRALLVEAAEDAIESLRNELPGWVVSDEMDYDRPGKPPESIGGSPKNSDRETD